MIVPEINNQKHTTISIRKVLILVFSFIVIYAFLCLTSALIADVSRYNNGLPPGIGYTNSGNKHSPQQQNKQIQRVSSDDNPNEKNIEEDTQTIERQQTIREAFIHAWSGYKKWGWGKDDLRPVSHKGVDWLGLGATIVDSLDTMIIMELYDEFLEARDWVVNNLNFEKSVSVSVFETIIRMVGGLLSAFELTKDRMFLNKAEELSLLLLQGFNTPTGIPYCTVNLKTGVAKNPRWSGGNSILSEIGTIQLEFAYLSHHTNNSVFSDKALAIYDRLDEVEKVHGGLYPIFISQQTGNFGGKEVISLGAMGDSYYEYLLKTWLLMGGPGTSGDKYRRMYDEATDAILQNLVKTSAPSGLTYIGEMDRGQVNGKMDELVCFIGGMFGLGAVAHNTTWNVNHRSDEHMKLGLSMATTCYEMWARMPTGIAPEFVRFNNDNDFAPGEFHYLLRPETLETFFVMHRLTHDPIWRQRGWEIFLAIEEFCKCEEGGYSGIIDVTKVPPTKDDGMPSYFLAETLKYLYLLFSPDDVIPLAGQPGNYRERYVLNTEAHPLRAFVG